MKKKTNRQNEKQRPSEPVRREEVTEKQKDGKKRGRFERQKEKAVLIFTDSQRFLNILLLPAV